MWTPCLTRNVLGALTKGIHINILTVQGNTHTHTHTHTGPAGIVWKLKSHAHTECDCHTRQHKTKSYVHNVHAEVAMGRKHRLKMRGCLAHKVRQKMSDFSMSLFSWLATTNKPEGGGNNTLPTNSSKGSVS